MPKLNTNSLFTQKIKNILIYTAHPAHVHFFKNIIHQLQQQGINIYIIARDKDITLILLNEFNFFQLVVGTIKQRKTKIGLLTEFIISIIYLIYIILKYRINLSLCIGGESISVASYLLFKTCYAITDTEHATTTNTITSRFATKIIIPSCYTGTRNRKTVEYPGYHELAYLHPNRFQPNIKVLDEAGLQYNDIFFIIRFVSWHADHDIGAKGFSTDGKIKIVKELEKYGKVLITSESVLPNIFKKYQVNIPLSKIHNLIYFSTFYIGEGGTMASEAAILGTPAVFVSSLRLGYLDELEKKYNLMFSFSDENAAIEKIIELLKIKNLKNIWQVKRENMLKEKIDVTQWIIDFINKQ